MKLRAALAYISIVIKKLFFRSFFYLIVSVISILLLIVIAFSLLLTYNDLTQESLTRRSTIVHLASTVVKERFMSLEELGVSLATRQRFSELVQQQKWEEAIPIMNTIPIDFPYVDRVFITDPKGILMADYPALPDVRGKDFSHRDWYKGVSKTWQPYVSEIYQRSAKPSWNVVAVAVPILSKTTLSPGTTEQTVTGILVLQIKLDTLFDWSTVIDPGTHAITYFVDKKGSVAGHPNYNTPNEIVNFSEHPVVKRVLLRENGIVQWRDKVAMKDNVSAYRFIPEYEWGVVVEQPAAEVFARRNNVIGILISIYLVFLLISCILIRILLRFFAKLETRQALTQKDVRFSSLIENSSDVIAIIDEKANITYTSPASSRLLGYSIKELLKKNGFTLIHPDDLEVTRKALMKLLVDPKHIAQARYRLKKKDGSWIWVEAVGTNLLTEPSVGGIVINYRDITERVYAENEIKLRSHELEESNASLQEAKDRLLHVLKDLHREKANVESEKNKMETLLISIGDGVFAVNAKSEIIMVNPVAEAVLGYTFTKIKHTHYTEIFHCYQADNPQQQWIDIINEVLQRKTASKHTKCIYKKKNGADVYLSLTASAIKDAFDNTIGCIIVFRDITQERYLEESKDNFFSMSAHQLRTPLGAMKWNLELLLNRYADQFSDEAKQTLQHVYSNNNRMIALTKDILKVLRIEQGKIQHEKEYVDIISVMKEELQDLNLIAQKKSLQIIMRTPKKQVPAVHIPSRRFRDVIRNLLSNSITYNNKPGEIIVSITVLKSTIRIDIKDTGIGIPRQDQSNIFTKFFRASNASVTNTEGTGLGLFVVQSYVKGWGGTVHFESAKGKGSTFSITIPLSKEDNDYTFDKSV